MGIHGYDSAHVKEFVDTTTRGWLFGDFGVPKSRGVIPERTPSELREKRKSDVIGLREITVSVLLNRERTERNRTTDEQKGDFYEWM